MVFTSSFWTALFKLCGTRLQLSSAYHPQTDGQTEVVNRTIEMYLRCLVGDKPRSWVDWVPWAEYCYNTAFHTALKTTPFQVVYGREPPRLLSYVPGATKVDAVDQALINRDEMLETIRQRLSQAQHHMKAVYDQGHRDLEFELGSWVWLRIHPYHQKTVTGQKHSKLSPKYFGPFRISQRVGNVAYQLELPSSSRIHNVFHVSLLKQFKGEPPTTIPTLPPLLNDKPILQPEAFLRTRLNRGQWEILVQW